MSTAAASKPRLVRRRSARARAHASVRCKLRVHSALRWLHIYTSMVSLLDRTVLRAHRRDAQSSRLARDREHEARQRAAERRHGSRAHRSTGSSVAEAAAHRAGRARNGERSARGLHEASITFKAPGYSADCFIDMATGKYKLTIAIRARSASSTTCTAVATRGPRGRG